ncbi:MAG: response regulator [Caldilinea sp.]|nr:response regulator [Caldilinea sp.]MCB0059023.1 response regulator [Caldilineaceae bacterium]MCB0068654.1 response regulator [Caldilineaceae bacterium]MCB0134491.1 response regulator [Caldilineaceae bacterium]MCB9113470.1 response regulator [Caldilineaceae bacterium]
MANFITILLVEDNPADVELTRESFEAAKIKNAMFVAPDGVEAMAFLRREGQYHDAPRPNLVLLDLNMPRKGGREVLAEIKGDPDLHNIPVVILTSSQAEHDVVTSYNLHANAYVSKPVDLTGFSTIVKAVEGFWFSVVLYPPE